MPLTNEDIEKFKETFWNMETLLTEIRDTLRERLPRIPASQYAPPIVEVPIGKTLVPQHAEFKSSDFTGGKKTERRGRPKGKKNVKRTGKS